MNTTRRLDSMDLLSDHPWALQEGGEFEQWMLTPTDEQRAAIDSWYEQTSMASGRQYGPDKYRPYAAGPWAHYSKLPLEIVNRAYGDGFLIENWSDLAQNLDRLARTDVEVRDALAAARA